MSLEEKGYKKRDTSDLLNWRMQVIDDGSIRITGVTKHGFKQCIENANIIEATTTHRVVASEGRRYLFYKDINWEKPLVPTRMLKKVGRKVTLGYAILDLLAESSLYALYMSDVLDLIRLQNMYPSMYDNMDMDEVAGLVIGAIRQRDSKQSSELI